MQFNYTSPALLIVKAKSFADREIRYTLKAQGQGAGTFNIGPSSGIVKLAKVPVFSFVLAEGQGPGGRHLHHRALLWHREAGQGIQFCLS